MVSCHAENEGESKIRAIKLQKANSQSNLSVGRKEATDNAELARKTKRRRGDVRQ